MRHADRPGNPSRRPPTHPVPPESRHLVQGGIAAGKGTESQGCGGDRVAFEEVGFWLIGFLEALNIGVLSVLSPLRHS